MKTPEERNFKIGQTVWYMDNLWAHVGKITRIRTTRYKQTSLHHEEESQSECEINGKWIPNCWVFVTKSELKGNLIHYIDNNSPSE